MSSITTSSPLLETRVTHDRFCSKRRLQFIAGGVMCLGMIVAIPIALHYGSIADREANERYRQEEIKTCLRLVQFNERFNNATTDALKTIASQVFGNLTMTSDAFSVYAKTLQYYQTNLFPIYFSWCKTT